MRKSPCHSLRKSPGDIIRRNARYHQHQARSTVQGGMTDMIRYNVQLNLGNEALNSGKTITANEVVTNADEKQVAHVMHLHNPLIPEDVAVAVLNAFCETAAELMADGHAVVLKAKGEAALRLYPDVHIDGGNINLERAKQLDPTVTDLTMDNAGKLAQLAGVTVRGRAEAEPMLTKLLNASKTGTERVAVVEKPYVARSGNTEPANPSNPSEPENPGTGGNGGNGGGGNNGGGSDTE